MNEKYIVIKGDAENHKNNYDKLDNTCNVVYTWADAYNDAMCYCNDGCRKAQVYKLEAEFDIKTVVVTQKGCQQTVKLEADK